MFVFSFPPCPKQKASVILQRCSRLAEAAETGELLAGLSASTRAEAEAEFLLQTLEKEVVAELHTPWAVSVKKWRYTTAVPLPMSIYKDRLYQILTQHFPYIWGQSSTRHHFRKFLVWARLKSVCRKLLLGPGSNYYVPGGRKLLMWARGSNYYVEHFWATGSNYCVENPIWGHRLKLLYKKLLGWATGSNPCVENSFWATGSNYCLLCKKLLCLATGSIFLVGNC